MVANLETTHSQQLSDWNKKGERVERQLTNIETEWQEISFLENSNEDDIASHRQQLEVKNKYTMIVYVKTWFFHSVFFNSISCLLYSRLLCLT